MTTTPTTREQAIRWGHDNGWAFIRLRGKVPIDRAWQHGERLPLDEILNHDGNIGLRTGSGLIVVDIDEGADLTGLDLPETVEVETGSGGRHLYYSHTGPLRNSAGRLAPHVDIRADGGQVVFPGSIHPDTGRHYRFIRAPWERDLAPLPEWIVERLTAPKVPASLPGAAAAPAASNGRTSPYVRTAVKLELQAVRSAANGSRNDTLNKAAFSLGQFVGSGALERGLAESELHAAAAAVGLGDVEAAATIKSGLDAGEREPRAVPESKAKSPEWWPEDNIEQHSTGKREVRLGVDEHRVNDEIIEALAGDPEVYARCGELVTVRPSDDPDFQGPTIEAIRPGLLRDMISRNTAFYKLKKPTANNLNSGKIVNYNGEQFVKISEHPPAYCVPSIHQRGHWPSVRRLIGIAPCPCLKKSGQLLTEKGFDPESGLFLWDAPAINVSSSPTADQVRKAKDLLDDLIADFPFESEAHAAGSIAFLFTYLARPAIAGPTPLFAVDAPVQGAGKGLLVNTVHRITAGSDTAFQVFPDTEDELKKLITSVLRAGRPTLSFDNVQRQVRGAALAVVLTSTIYSDRVLGESRLTPDLPVRTIFSITGNGLTFDRDMERRVVPIRLVPSVERPEERTGFRHAHLLTYATENRADLLGAALTVLRGWTAAGRPDQGLPTWGSFEAWSGIVRNALVWAGWADPFIAKRALAAANQSEVEPVRAVLDLLAEIDPHGEGVTAAELLAAAVHESAGEAGEAVATFATRRGGKPTALVLGQRLGRYRDRILDGRKLVRMEKSNRGILWTHRDVGDVGDVHPATPREPF